MRVNWERFWLGVFVSVGFTGWPLAIVGAVAHNWWLVALGVILCVGGWWHAMVLGGRV